MQDHAKNDVIRKVVIAVPTPDIVAELQRYAGMKQQFVDSLEAPTANERLEMPAADDRAGHFKHVIIVDDYSRAGRHYEFYLGIDIQPREIWIVQCDCWLVDRDGNIVWMSDQ